MMNSAVARWSKAARSSVLVDDLPDEQLIARCANGDRNSMDVLVARYHSRILDFAFRHLKDREAAADIAQMTLVRAFQNAGSYRAQASFKTWLYTIAMNGIRDHCRRVTIRGEVTISEHAYDDTPSGQPDLEETVVNRMALSGVWDAVAALPEGQGSAIILRFRQGLSYDEIADVLNAPSGTVKSWVHYGLKALRQTLEPLNCEG
jgi:RNA polymerase sigma-70 factor (ECF subfamily)